MNSKIFVFFFLILAFSNVSAKSALVDKINSHIDTLNMRPLESTQSTKIWDSIITKANKEDLSWYCPDRSCDASKTRFFRILYPIYTYLIQNKKIRFLNDFAKKELGIESYYSHKDGKYHKTKVEGAQKMSALYIPLNHMILLDETSPNLEATLLHELIHAFQYIVRLPLDLDYLTSIENLDKQEALDYLSFYYEALANWHTLSLYTPEEWGPYLYRKRNRWFDVKSSMLNLTYGLALSVSSESLEPLIPRHLMKHISDTRNGLSFATPILLKGAKAQLYFASEMNLKLHYLFGRSIERAYFDHADFLFRDDFGDQKIFKSLEERYYDSFLSLEVNKIKVCQIVWSKIITKAKSPLVFWANVDSEKIGDCEIYQSFLNNNKARAILNSQDDKKSIFNIVHPGSEGSRPDFDITNYLRIHPQLEILPIEE